MALALATVFLRFERRLYSLASGGEDEELDDVASVGAPV